MSPVPQRPVEPAGSPAEAIAGGYFAQVRYLLELTGPAGADAREPTSGRTPLILCALVEPPGWGLGLARLLLEKGARVGLKDRRGMNALHYACAHGRDQLANLYLQAIDYRVDDVDRYRNSVMHYAVRSGSLPIVDSLLIVFKRLQLSVSPSNKENVTPLMLAYMGNNIDIADRLLEAGADANVVDAFGKSTATYQREAMDRLRATAEAKEAKIAGRKLRFDDLDGWQRHQRRLRSAPSSGRPATATFKEAQQENRRTRMYQPDRAELISAASPLDRRNDPMEVFRTNPVDFFGPTASKQQSQQQSQQHQFLSVTGVQIASPLRQTAATVAPRYRRAQSALPLRRHSARREDVASTAAAAAMESDGNESDRSKDSREMKLLGSKSGESGTKTDAVDSGVELISSLFHNYEFHCSSLYRPPPRVPDPQLYVQDFAARFLTPPQADPEAAGVAGEMTPVGGRRRGKEAVGRKAKRGMAAAAAVAVAATSVGGGSAAVASAGPGGGLQRKATGSGAVGVGGVGGGRISRAAFGRDE